MTNRIPRDMTTLRRAVRWIAEEDAPGDDDDVDALSGYLTVHLTAHLFGVEPIYVARKVASCRKRNGVVA